LLQSTSTWRIGTCLQSSQGAWGGKAESDDLRHDMGEEDDEDDDEDDEDEVEDDEDAGLDDFSESEAKFLSD